MSKLEELIQQYCPDGVESVPLSSIGTIRRGNGLQKKDFVKSGVGCIHYGQIYTKFGAFAEKTLTFVNEELASHLLHIETGDLVIACTSENVEDVCKAVAWLGEDTIVTGGHSCVLHHNQNPKYVAYFFQTEWFQSQKRKYAYGTKVIDIKPDNIGKIVIPVPPLPVQEEIVRILDNFTELQAELQAELQKRLQQYKYYRDNILSFEGRTDVYWQKLGKMCSVLRGKRLTKSQLSSGGRYKVFHGGIEPIGHYDECNREANTTMVINVGASAGTVGFSKDMFWSSDGCFCLSHTPLFSGRYLYYYLQTREPYLMSRVRRAGIPTLDGKVLEELIIPVPPVNEQKEIVSILDRFDRLTTDLTQGLPAEIEKRRQQYEYYRDKLLTFKRKAA